jgi:hypothetical protein
LKGWSDDEFSILNENILLIQGGLFKLSIAEGKVC